MGTSAAQTAQKKRDTLKALKLSDGNVSTAVEKANSSRTAHYQWLKDDEAYKEAVSDINESLVDLSEELLRRRGKGYEYTETSIVTEQQGEGEPEIVRTTVTTKQMPENVDAIKAHLSAKGRERGYGTKIEVGGMKDAPPIEVGMVKIVTRGKDKPK